MIRRKVFGFYIVLIPLMLLAFACTKTDTTSVLADDEQRLLRQYIITHDIKTQPLSSGLYYLPVDTGTGLKPLSTDVVFYNYTLRLLDDKILLTNIDSVAKMNQLFRGGIFYRPTESRLSWSITGLQQGIELLHEGGKATFIIPSSLAFGSTGSSSNGIGSYYTVIYDVELLKVVHDPIAYEQQQINKYILDSISSSLTVSKNDSGVYHIITQEGIGAVINDSTTVTMLYTLKLMDGTVIEKVTDSSNPFSYDIATASVVPGFKQAIMEMKKTEEAIIIIPYKQGYGETPGTLPAFSTLVYSISILSATNTFGAK